jgi:hypothetical protein
MNRKNMSEKKIITICYITLIKSSTRKTHFKLLAPTISQSADVKSRHHASYLKKTCPALTLLKILQQILSGRSDTKNTARPPPFQDPSNRVNASLPYLKTGQPSPVKTVSIAGKLASRRADCRASARSAILASGSIHNSPAT